MPLPIVPIGILWIVAAAASLGVLGTLVVLFAADEISLVVIAVCFAVIAFLLIPFLPNNWSWARQLKSQIRSALKTDDEYSK